MTDRPEHSPLGASGAERHPTLPIMADRDGRVYNLAGRILKPRADKDGYLLVDCGPRGGRKTVRVHRVVMATFHGEDPREVDHKDRNRAHCAEHNLRYLSISANRRNIGVRYDSGSQIRNVRWRKDRQVWQAYCRKDGAFKSLGHFDTQEEASGAARPHY